MYLNVLSILFLCKGWFVYIIIVECVQLLVEWILDNNLLHGLPRCRDLVQGQHGWNKGFDVEQVSY